MILFLLSVMAISLSGVMMPGPLLAVTMIKSYRSQTAGIGIALGHGAVEFPLMLLIYFGLIEFLKLPVFKSIIGLVGGLTLIYLGTGVIRHRSSSIQESENLAYNSVAAGALASASNPYFFLWWATIGAALIMKSTSFGLVGFILLATVHWLCDLGWYLTVSLAIYRTQRFWGGKLQKILYAICGLTLFGFGAYFIYSAVR